MSGHITIEADGDDPLAYATAVLRGIDIENTAIESVSVEVSFNGSDDGGVNFGADTNDPVSYAAGALRGMDIDGDSVESVTVGLSFEGDVGAVTRPPSSGTSGEDTEGEESAEDAEAEPEPSEPAEVEVAEDSVESPFGVGGTPDNPTSGPRVDEPNVDEPVKIRRKTKGHAVLHALAQHVGGDPDVWVTAEEVFNNQPVPYDELNGLQRELARLFRERALLDRRWREVEGKGEVGELSLNEAGIAMLEELGPSPWYEAHKDDEE